MHSVAVSYQQYLNRAMASLAGLCALCAFLYGVFLLETVIHAAARQTAERQIQAIAATLGNLESQYLAQNKNLTPGSAASLGFVAPTSVTTVYSSAGVLTLNP